VTLFDFPAFGDVEKNDLASELSRKFGSLWALQTAHGRKGTGNLGRFNGDGLHR
jgi:hypothetical protein